MEKIIDCYELPNFGDLNSKLVIIKRNSPWGKTERKIIEVERKLPLDFIPISLDYLVSNQIEPDVDNLRICYYDLECDDRDPSLDLSKKKILCASFIDSANREFFLIEDDEEILLKKIQKFFEIYDVLIGWNNSHFDFPLLETRGKLYNINFKKYSRKNVDLIKLMDKFNNINVIMSSANLPDFSLDTVGSYFLKLKKIEIRDEKLDTRYGGTIMRLFETNRELLKKYNLRDVEIVKKLDEYFEVTKTAKILSQLSSTLFLDTCQSINNNIESYLLREILKRDKKTQKFLFEKLRESHYSLHHSYKGALNYLKSPGFYNSIAIYDFKSMYPNLIRTFNISFETVDKEIENEEDLKKLLSKPRGILAEIEDKLQEERYKYKKMGKKTQETGIKLIANSLYGYWGGKYSLFKNINVASTITWTGRFVLSLLINNYPEIKYCDTDSIFITLPKDKNYLEYEKEINEFLKQKLFEKFPELKNSYYLYLEFEKLFSKLILVSKKKYIGYVIVDNKNKRDYLYGKGIELVRKDYTLYGKNFLDTIIKKILIKNANEEEIRRYILEEKSKILNNEIPIKKLGITQRLSKLPEEYKTLPIHAKIALEDSKKGIPYFVGQRITYVVLRRDSKNNLIGKSLHSITENDKYDGSLYWSQKIYPMVERLLEVVFPNSDWKALRDPNNNYQQMKLF